MTSSSPDINALIAELEAEKAKVRALEHEVEGLKAKAQPGQMRSVHLARKSLHQSHDSEVSVLHLDMDVMDVCCVEVDWNAIMKTQTRCGEGNAAGGGSKSQRKRTEDRSKEIIRAKGCESWRYRPFSGLDVQPEEGSLAEKQQNRISTGNINDIHEFCFPSGAHVQYMSKSAAEVLVGEQFDQFHIMQFANASGQQSYASVLTVTRVVKCDDMGALDTLARVAAMRRPVRIIRDFMRKLVKYVKKERWLNVELPGLESTDQLGNENSPNRQSSSSSTDTPQSQSRAERMYAYLSEAAASSSMGVSNSNSQGEDHRPSTNTLSGTLFGGAGSLSISEKPKGEAKDEKSRDGKDGRESVKERESMFSFGSGGATRGMFSSPAASFGSLVPGKDKKQADIIASIKESKDGAKEDTETEVIKEKEKEEEMEKGRDNKDKAEATIDGSMLTAVETVSSAESEDGHGDKNKSSANEPDISFFGRMRTRWNAQMASAVRERRLSLRDSKDGSGAMMSSPANLGDRECSSSILTVEGATTTNPDSELMLMKHSYNQMTADIHMLPEAPPDVESDIMLYEASKKKDYTSSIAPQRKMSLSVRNRSGSGKEDTTRGRFGSQDEDTTASGEEQPMLIPGISTTTDLSSTSEKEIILLDVDTYSSVTAAEAMPSASHSVTWDTVGSNCGSSAANDMALGETSATLQSKDNKLDEENETKEGKREDSEEEEEEALDPRRHDGKVVVSEVAYCLVSSHCIQTLAYYILKRLADAERDGGIIEVSGSGCSCGERINPSLVGDEGANNVNESALSRSRNKYLRAVHLSLMRWCISGGMRNFAARSSQLFTNALYANGLEDGAVAAKASSVNGSVTIGTVISVSDGFAPLIPRPNGLQTTPSSSRKRATSGKMRRSSESRASLVSDELKEVQVPGYLYPLGIHLASAAPVEEWALLITLSYLNSGIILKLINLLLMEKSLVVVGSYPAIVSMVSLGIKNLILPFKWEGVFVPLVPTSARELFGAPVPYILGTTHAPRESEVSATSAILFLQEQEDSIFLRYNKAVGIPSGVTALKEKENDNKADTGVSIRSDMLLHIASLNEKQHYPVAETVAWFVRLPDTINADMPHDETVAKNIDTTRRYLRACRTRALGTRMAPLGDRSDRCRPPAKLDMQYLTSMSLKERRAVSIIARVLHSHNMQFCGDSVDPTAWRRYVKYNHSTEEEEFYPNWFMQPVRRHVEFQEAVVQTQLFVGFMDAVREEAEKQDKYRTFIYDWLTFRIHLARKRL